METKIETKLTFTLILNETEALWLKGQVQNPMHGQSYEDEQPQDKKMRKIFWDALDEQITRNY